MSPSALPLISERDYPAFQRMIPELLNTAYAEWLEEHKKAVAYRQSRNGFVEIPFSPWEFAAWLEVNGEAAHMELLWVFAEDKATAGSRPS
jgi:hypothetical protein